MTSLHKLHVLHIASGDLWAGAEVQLFTLARMLKKRGNIRVTVILLNDGELAKRLRQADIETFVFSESCLGFPRLMQLVFGVIKQLKPDVIHTHRLKENVLGAMSGLLLGIPSLRTQHGAEEHPASWHTPHKALLQRIDHWLAAHVQKRVVAVTPELAHRLTHQLPAGQVEVIENGVDPTLFTLIDVAQLELRFLQAKRRVGIAGRLVPVKRVDLFIEMAAMLVEDAQLADVHFFIFGDGPLRAQLYEYAIKRKLNERVHFMGHQHAIHTYIKHLDALVMCSDHEGLPMTLLETMSLDTAVVGHDVGGIKLLLDNGTNGYFVQNQDPTAYATALRDCLNNTAMTAEKKRNARLLIESRYSAHKNTEEFVHLYQKLQKY